MEKEQILNQQNTNLSNDNAEAVESLTGLLDFIQNEKEAQTEKENNKKELQAEKEKEEGSMKDILVESKLNKKVETNKETEEFPEVSSLLLSTSEFCQNHAVPQERY